MPQRAMTELGTALAPGDDFVAVEQLGCFVNDLLFAREIAIGNFAVVEDGFRLLRRGLRPESQIIERGAAGVAGDFLSSEVSGTERGARIAGDGLHIDGRKWTALLQRAHQQNIQKHAPRNAEIAHAGLLMGVGGELENNFLEKVLSAAGQVRSLTNRKVESSSREAELPV